MEYRTVAEARGMRGLRLVLTMGVPGPWGEAAKGILHVKNISYIPVGQRAGESNPDLTNWTGIRNAPVAILDEEKPLDGWLNILLLAERRQASPPLLPATSEERALVVGISNEICGEWGFGWCRRTILTVEAPPAQDPATQELLARMRTDYRCSDDALGASHVRAAEIVAMLCRRLQAQRASGSPYLVGRGLTAADIYWACFAALIKPLPEEVNPMPATARERYELSAPLLDKAMAPILFEHRDFIYARHLKLPLDF